MLSSGIEADFDDRHLPAMPVAGTTTIDLAGPLAGNAGGLLRKLDQLNTDLHDAIFIGALLTWLPGLGRFLTPKPVIG